MANVEQATILHDWFAAVSHTAANGRDQLGLDSSSCFLVTLSPANNFCRSLL